MDDMTKLFRAIEIDMQLGQDEKNELFNALILKLKGLQNEFNLEVFSQCPG